MQLCRLYNGFDSTRSGWKPDFSLVGQIFPVGAAPPVQIKGGLAYSSQNLEVSLFVLFSIEETSQNLPLVSKLLTSVTCEKFKAWEGTLVPRVCCNSGFTVTPVLLLPWLFQPFRRAGNKVMVAWSTKSAIKAEKGTNSVCGGRSSYNIPLKLEWEAYIQGGLESNPLCFPITALVFLGCLAVILYHWVT